MIRNTLFALLLTQASSAIAWEDDYLYALESLERANYQAAILALEKAIAAKPDPELAVGEHQFDYLPYLNLAAAYYETGDVDAARDALVKAQQTTPWRDSYVARKIWDRYALPIMATSRTQTDETRSYDDYSPADYVISERQAKKIKSEVLRRCALSGKGPRGSLPWYFHYEYGIELMQAGDPQRALDEFIKAANRRENSSRNSRMYGMWFTPYLPYYQIAQAHSKLGNWQCAMDAMRLSVQYSEFRPLDPGYEQYSDLQKLILRQADNEKG